MIGNVKKTERHDQDQSIRDASQAARNWLRPSGHTRTPVKLRLRERIAEVLRCAAAIFVGVALLLVAEYLFFASELFRIGAVLAVIVILLVKVAFPGRR